MATRDDSNRLWGKHTRDYSTNTWLKDAMEIPFLEAQFKSFGEAREGAPWKGLDVGCGMGKYTVRLLQAGASYVLATDLSADMAAGTKKSTQEYLDSQSRRGTDKAELPKVDIHVCSGTDLSSIPGVPEGTFDLAICIYVCCNLLSKEEVKAVLAEIFRMLKPGGKLMIYETHILQYLRAPNNDLLAHVPKEDGTERKYFEDEGNPVKLRMKMNSGETLEIVNRYYTLSFWVAAMLAAGFQITQHQEPHLNSRDVPPDAPASVKDFVDCPIAMFWECTKPF